MKKITTRNNPLIKRIAALQQAKYRKMKRQFIAEGIRACSTLVSANHQPILVCTTNAMLHHAQQLVDGQQIVLVTTAVMKKISTANTPSGLLCLFPMQPISQLKQLNNGIVLARINNPGNMGTLIRSAAAMNKKLVVIIEGVDPWHPKVVQASAGTIGLVNIIPLTWQELIDHKGLHKLCALVVTNGKKPHKINLNNMLLVIGGESDGIPQNWINECDEKLTLPMPGNIESLNAAVAGSIALYLMSTEQTQVTLEK